VHTPTDWEVREYLPLVRPIVMRFLRRLPPNVLRDDLMAAGTYGLLDALRKHTSERGAAFEWYARVRIRGAILDELRAQDWLTRRARTRVTEAGQGAASPSGQAVVSLDDLPESTRAGLTDADALNPFDHLVRARDQSALAGALGRLGERERLIVTRYYLQGVPFKSIAATLGVSEPRVSQLHARAIGQLRNFLETDAAPLAA
jgi:RNA polymerase sigma factor for flagellar operon FliA